MREDKVIAIHGSYFGRNFGDTLIVSIVKNWVKEASPDALINLPFVNSTQEAQEICGDDKFIVDPALNNCRALVFGPGGYFGEPNGSFIRKQYWYLRNYRRHLGWNGLLQKQSIPYAIVGVGVGPVSNILMRRRIIQLFKGASYVAVRDEMSRDFLVSWGVPADKVSVTRDVALTTKRTKPRREKCEKLKVGIHFSGSELTTVGKMDEFMSFVYSLCRDYDVCLVEDEPGQATTLVKGSIFARLSADGLTLPVIKYKNPDTLLGDLQDLDAIITSKLHVGILGYSFGIPVLAIPKHQKTQRFYSQIKRSEFCLSYDQVNSKSLRSVFELCISSPIVANELEADAAVNKVGLQEFIRAV